jgi:hypothetical protein
MASISSTVSVRESSPFPFITDAQFELLLANGRLSREHQLRDELFDPQPVVKLFVPDSGAVWLLTEVDEMQPRLAFGLADLGMGLPEMGYIDLLEIQEACGVPWLSIAQDTRFQATKSLSEYACDARRAGHIVS